MKKIIALLAAGLAALGLVACETVSYYGQAVAGQFYILTHRDKIRDLIADQDTEPELREKLESILDIRAFAERELSLPAKDNFSTYVDLERPYAVWNVFATPEFSMQPVKWCYPIAGCVSYRGYFDKKGARRFAEGLDDKHYDVYLGGVAAYSTLGWFPDPVLNTVMHREDHKLASLVFHELAHQVVYVPGDTQFNESFATAVELEGMRRWLAASERDDEESARILEDITLTMNRREDFVGLVQGAVRELKQLYASDLAVKEMREEKDEVFDRLRDDYKELKEYWGGYDGYDGFFDRKLNNARLNTVATYFDLVPAFTALLAEENHDLSAFYARVHQLGRLPRDERYAVLDLLDVIESPAITSR